MPEDKQKLKPAFEQNTDKQHLCSLCIHYQGQHRLWKAFSRTSWDLEHFLGTRMYGQSLNQYLALSGWIRVQTTFGNKIISFNFDLTWLCGASFPTLLWRHWDYFEEKLWGSLQLRDSQSEGSLPFLTAHRYHTDPPRGICWHRQSAGRSLIRDCFKRRDWEVYLTDPYYKVRAGHITLIISQLQLWC